MLAQRSQNFIRQLASLFPLDLQLGLLAQAGERLLVDPLNWVRWANGQSRHRRDAGQLEASGLVATHTRYEAKVIILPAAQLADVDPSADAAVVDGIGIGLDGGRHHRLLKAALDAS